MRLGLFLKKSCHQSRYPPSHPKFFEPKFYGLELFNFVLNPLWFNLNIKTKTTQFSWLISRLTKRNVSNSRFREFYQTLSNFINLQPTYLPTYLSTELGTTQLKLVLGFLRSPVYLRHIQAFLDYISDI